MFKTTTNDAAYDRMRDLPRMLRLWPQEIGRLSESDQAWLVERLAQVLRAERQRGLTRHWSYDLSRHAGLLRAYRAEKQLLDLQTKAATRLQALNRMTDHVQRSGKRLSLQPGQGCAATDTRTADKCNKLHAAQVRSQAVAPD